MPREATRRCATAICAPGDTSEPPPLAYQFTAEIPRESGYAGPDEPTQPPSSHLATADHSAYAVGEAPWAGAGAVVVGAAGEVVEVVAGGVGAVDDAGGTGIAADADTLTVPFGHTIGHRVEHGVHHVPGEAFPVWMEMGRSETREVPGVDLGKDSSNSTVTATISRSASRRGRLTRHRFPRSRS